MKIIAHMGLDITHGADEFDRRLDISHKGNNPHYVDETLKLGVDVELDVWIYDDGNSIKFYLGHDYPQYEVSIEYLKDIKDRAWLHCKNYDALRYLTVRQELDFNYFWHDEDDFVITSKQFIWSGLSTSNWEIHRIPKANKSTVLVLSYHEWSSEWTEKNWLNIYHSFNFYGFCTDQPQFVRNYIGGGDVI